ncbi:Mitochondrial carrier domain [Pseudocohnilembus persalinus]|uniref:Mitochondrial carrier domain n=1 Tax=Pseudocohnilembus persalinus TaxID=266149 RepID=A0A0V0QH85_PSEPJ|nr:Mitochondrial carrier domain [Pseudocohnilembus persalinus]|eukprot:KRX01597.1 Mitochondrial carrier domain [Pseudocohnilembus persalinus]
METQNSTYNFRESLKEYGAGAISAWTQTILAYPLDVVKSRLQVSKSAYKGPLQCIQFMVKNEGYGSFFRGMLNPLLLMTVINSMYFGSIDALKRVYKAQYQLKDEEIPLKAMFAIAGASACYSDLVLIPMERIKIKLQVQNNKLNKEYNGSLSAAIKLIQQGGVKTLYKGACISLMRDFLGCGTFFVTYEILKRKFAEFKQQNTNINFESPGMHFIELAGSGMVSGWAFWLLAYPLDVIRARLQSDSLVNSKFRGYSDVISYIYKQKGGISNFYRGLPVTLIMSSVYSSSCIYTWEVSKILLDNCIGKFE